MDFVFIFEDSADTPSSKLLKAAFMKDFMYFSNGASHVFKTLMRLYDPKKEFIVFYDTVPNNPKTLKGYGVLLQSTRRMRNVHVVPIICIEYIVLRMFLRYGYLTSNKTNQVLIDSLLRQFNWKSVPEEYRTRPYMSSLETCYKMILNTQNLKCLRNKSVKKDKLYGKFYISDCDCRKYYCPSDSTDSLILKAERLYTSLPMYIIVNREHRMRLDLLGIEFHECSVGYITEKVREFYDDVCSQLDTTHIPIAI